MNIRCTTLGAMLVIAIVCAQPAVAFAANVDRIAIRLTPGDDEVHIAALGPGGYDCTTTRTADASQVNVDVVCVRQLAPNERPHCRDVAVLIAGTALPVPINPHFIPESSARGACASSGGASLAAQATLRGAGAAAGTGHGDIVPLDTLRCGVTAPSGYPALVAVCTYTG